MGLLPHALRWYTTAFPLYLKGSTVVATCVKTTLRLFLQYFDALTYQDDDVVRTVLIAIWAAAEPCRLVAGYFGNLQEHVSLCPCFISPVRLSDHRSRLMFRVFVNCRLNCLWMHIPAIPLVWQGSTHWTAICPTFHTFVSFLTHAAALAHRVHCADNGSTPRYHVLHAYLNRGREHLLHLVRFILQKQKNEETGNPISPPASLFLPKKFRELKPSWNRARGKLASGVVSKSCIDDTPRCVCGP